MSQYGIKVGSTIFPFHSDTACGKKESKLELAASMIRHVMPVFHEKNVIILCDSWYDKKNLVAIIDEYENLDMIGNARSDSVIYDLPP